MRVRAATAGDVAPLIQAGLVAFADHLSPPRVEPTIAMVETAIHVGTVLIAIEDEKILGAIGLEIAQWDHSGEQYVRDIFTFSKCHAAFAALVDEAKRVAARVKLTLYLGVTGSRVAAASRLYQSLGGELAGALFRF